MPNPRLTLFLTIATVLGCQDATGPTVGVAEITVAVSGVDIDPDGFDVVVDARVVARVAGPGPVTLDLSPGQHTIVLAGLASNCARQVPAVRTFTVTRSATAQVSLGVACTALTGVVQVFAATTGTDIGAGTYQISIDNGPVRPLGPNAAIFVPDVAGGAHSLQVTGLPTNCRVAGPNPLNVGVSVGGLARDTSRVTVNVTCTALSGVIRVTTTTTGLDPAPPSSYRVSLDGGVFRTVGTDGTLLIPGVPGGAHSLRLSGVPPNCGVAGSNPVITSVGVGGLIRDTVTVSFAVTCLANPVLRVTVTTNGPGAPAGYFVYADYYYYYGYGFGTFIPSNGTVAFSLSPGGHSVSLGQVPPNCTVTSNNFISVDLLPGTTTELAFAVLCS